MVLRQGGRDTLATRGASPGLPGHGWKDFEGEFYSDELHVLYKVALKDEKLMLSYPRGTLELAFVSNGAFASGFPGGDLIYQCTRADCAGFTVNSERTHNVQFRRVAFVGPGAHADAATGVFLQPTPQLGSRARLNRPGLRGGRIV